MKVTVFTATYNRASLLGNLYKSLLAQTCMDFEWLIINDGSTDNTESVVQTFMDENKIRIVYRNKSNGGKHTAINLGVTMACGELFFIVDSDDYLAFNSIERILYYYETIKNDESFAGVCGLKVFESGKPVGGGPDFGILDCNALDFRFKYRVKGDMAEVFRTTVLREFSFPEIPGERFCPEALVWNRIAQQYRLRFFYEKIYVCDYLPDGLTAKITQLRMNSREASLIHYSELYKLKIPLLQKIKAAINFWRFSFCSDRALPSLINQISLFSLVYYPLGFLLHVNDQRK